MSIPCGAFCLTHQIECIGQRSHRVKSKSFCTHVGVLGTKESGCTWDKVVMVGDA